MNLRLDPWFAQLENLVLVDVAIGAILLLIVTFLLSVPGTREGIPHRFFRLFGPVSVYGFATWWMIQVRHATTLSAIALGFLTAAITDLLVPRRSRPARHLTITDWAQKILVARGLQRNSESPSLIRWLPDDVKRESNSPVDKPFLDEETFQQLLAAANILQQHNYGLLAKEPEADYALTLSDGATAENVGPIQVVRPETGARPVASLEPQPKLTPARLGYLYRTLGKRFALMDELFWQAATVVAAAAVSALLFGATIYRLSPLPSALAVPSEGVQQRVPFKGKRIAMVPAESGAIGTRSWSRRPVVADQWPGRGPSPASAQKTAMNPARPYSTYESEADVIAKDTTVRYDTHSAARLQARKKH